MLLFLNILPPPLEKTLKSLAALCLTFGGVGAGAQPEGRNGGFLHLVLTGGLNCGHF